MYINTYTIYRIQRKHMNIQNTGVNTNTLKVQNTESGYSSPVGKDHSGVNGVGKAKMSQNVMDTCKYIHST
jgi:hypothetical protein